jgi:hypothetical protein
VKKRSIDTLLLTLGKDLRERGKLDLREDFIDWAFAPAKKGNVPFTKIMAVANTAEFPIAIHVANASLHEVTLVEKTLD